MERPVRLVVNPSAGGGRAARVLPAYQDALSARGITASTHVTTGLPHAAELAAEGADRGEIVATLGGDGLIGCVAGALRGREDALLAVLPGGRGNDLARVLQIPSEPDAAVAVIAEGEVRTLDLGEVDGKLFVGIASCGYDSEANRIANESRLVKGHLVYLYAGLRALATWKPARFTLSHDGRREEHVGYTVAAANSKAYGGGMFLAPNAELDDGLLDVVISADTSKLRFLRGLPKVFKGAHLDEPSIQVFRTAELTISADRPFALYADGDPIADLPATVRCVPAALRVLVPRGS